MKKLLSITLVTVLAFALAACSSPAKNGKSTAAPSTASGKTININMSYFADTQTAADMWDKYFVILKEKYPNYNVNFELLPTTGPEEIVKAKVAGGDFPDLMYVYQPALLIDGGVIQEMPKVLEDMLLRPGDFKVNGKLYTMPLHMGTLGYWYNKQIFEKAGITSLPESWTDFIATLKKLKAYGVEPMSTTMKEGWSGVCIFDYLWSDMTYGPEPNWSKLRTEGKVKFNNPVTKRALEQFKETIPYWQKGAMSASYDEIRQLFYAQKTAILQGGIWSIPQIDSGEIVPDFDVGYLLPPTDDPTMRKPVSYQDNLWVISSAATGEKFDAVVNMLKLYYSDEFYQTALTADASLPVIKGFEDKGPLMTNPKAKVMMNEIMAASNKFGTVPLAHSTQGDNMWPAGCREMSEKIVQEIAAGNNNFDALMKMFDDQWDKGVEQAKQGTGK